jgi:osomolarity two-component system sensor histidine kinase SLN1
MSLWTRSDVSIKGAEAVGMPNLHNGSTNKQNGSFNMSKLVTPIPAEILPVPVQHGVRKQKKTARIGGGLKVHWANFRKRIGTGTAPSTSSMVGDSSAAGSSQNRPHATTTTDEETGEVDEIVVDRTWSEEIKSSVAHSEAEARASPEKSNSHQPPETTLDHESMDHYDGFWGLWSPLVFIRWRLWPMALEFFTCRFFDEKSEEHYRKENWFMRKVCVWSVGD